MLSQRARRNEGGLSFGSRIGGNGSKMTKRCQPPLAQYPLRIFPARAKQPADSPFIRGQRAERIIEVGLLRVSVAKHDQLVLVVPGCLAAKEYRIGLGAEVLFPDFFPDVASRCTERPLISLPQNWYIGSVIEIDE